jgi:aspartate/methionine/tyrosine aminotransferase
VWRFDVHIDLFEMERMQSLYFHEVDYDLSESGVFPLTIAELLGDGADPGELLATKLAYPLSEGSVTTRERIARWYPGATADNVTVVNGGSEANHLTLWALHVPGDMLGLDRGIRFGYGYDIERTMEGLARVDEVLATISR